MTSNEIKNLAVQVTEEVTNCNGYWAKKSVESIILKALIKVLDEKDDTMINLEEDIIDLESQVDEFENTIIDLKAELCLILLKKKLKY